jgi:hypothetical protein
VPADALNARTRAGMPMAPWRTEPQGVHAYRPVATSATDLGGRSGFEAQLSVKETCVHVMVTVIRQGPEAVASWVCVWAATSERSNCFNY